MSAIVHTPYDGSAKPFTIGLKPLDINDWIDIDAQLPRYLDEKQYLAGHHINDIIVSEAGSEAAQQEVLDLLCAHLCTQYPDQYKLSGNTMALLQANRHVDLLNAHVPTIHIAASLVQEDLVIMSRDATGWRLVAASVCFPSAWNLREKFGKPMQEIHAPVPGFGVGTRNAELIERMFDNLQIDHPVMRWNWSLYGDDLLHHPDADNQGRLRFGDKAEPENINLRLERQTLRKLPITQTLLFTIRIYINPLQMLDEHKDGQMLAKCIADQISVLSNTEIAYKGLTDERNRLLSHLNR